MTLPTDEYTHIHTYTHSTIFLAQHMCAHRCCESRMGGVTPNHEYCSVLLTYEVMYVHEWVYPHRHLNSCVTPNHEYCSVLLTYEHIYVHEWVYPHRHMNSCVTPNHEYCSVLLCGILSLFNWRIMYIHEFICLCGYTHKCTYMNSYVYVGTLTHVHTWIHMSMWVHSFMYIHDFICLCGYTHGL